MGWPAGPKTVFSTKRLDLVSDATRIRSDVIFLPMYINPSIFSVISSPGPEVPVPGSLGKDRDTFGSRGHVCHYVQERHHSQKPTQGVYTTWNSNCTPKAYRDWLRFSQNPGRVENRKQHKLSSKIVSLSGTIWLETGRCSCWLKNTLNWAITELLAWSQGHARSCLLKTWSK